MDHYAVMPLSDYKALCDTLRQHGATGKITSGQLAELAGSIAGGDCGAYDVAVYKEASMGAFHMDAEELRAASSLFSLGGEKTGLCAILIGTTDTEIFAVGPLMSNFFGSGAFIAPMSFYFMGETTVAQLAFTVDEDGIARPKLAGLKRNDVEETELDLADLNEDGAFESCTILYFIPASGTAS